MVVLRERFDPIPDFEEEQEEPLTYEQATERATLGAHPLLEARVVYAAGQQAASHYLKPMRNRERIYPKYAIHAQASGRWSITGPPLGQFPRPKNPIGRAIQECIIPDEGTVWLGWDWKQIEPRLEAYLSGEQQLIDLFESGGDPYRLYAQLMGWENPTDEQRQFAKRHRLKMSYGGDKGSDTPGSKKLGLTKADLERAGSAIINGLPRLAAYWSEVQGRAFEEKQVRTFDGRVRVLLGQSEKALREALNHPNQGGVASILNTTIIRIQAALDYVLMVYTVHDAGWIEIPEERYAEAKPVIQEIVTAEWEINKRRIRFPADFKERR
jgi:DNA polymerase I-like protein with 3'-5' exonuclease and polymerase domains